MNLYSEAVRRLRQCFLARFGTRLTFTGIRGSPNRSSRYFLWSLTSLISLDSMAVIVLARAHGLDDLLPATFFIATVEIDCTKLLSGHNNDDGKLRKHADEDIARSIRARNYLEVAARRIFGWLLLPPSRDCSDPRRCEAASVRNLEEIWHWDLSLSWDRVLLDDRRLGIELQKTYCLACTVRNEELHAQGREFSWGALPLYFDLPQAQRASSRE